MDRVAIMIPEILAALRGVSRAAAAVLAAWLLPAALEIGRAHV